MVKNLPAIWEPWVQSLSWEDPLEKGKASILAWRILWTEKSGRLQSMRSQTDTTERLSLSCSVKCIFYTIQINHLA